MAQRLSVAPLPKVACIFKKPAMFALVVEARRSRLPRECSTSIVHTLTPILRPDSDCTK